MQKVGEGGRGAQIQQLEEIDGGALRHVEERWLDGGEVAAHRGRVRHETEAVVGGGGPCWRDVVR